MALRQYNINEKFLIKFLIVLGVIFFILIIIVIRNPSDGGKKSSEPQPQSSEQPISNQTTQQSKEALEITEYASKMGEIANDLSKSSYALANSMSIFPYWSEEEIILIAMHTVILEGLYDRAKKVVLPQKFSLVHQKYLSAFKLFRDAMPIMRTGIDNLNSVLIDKSTNMFLQATTIMEQANVELKNLQ